MSLEPAMRKLPADPQRAGVCDIMQVGDGWNLEKRDPQPPRSVLHRSQARSPSVFTHSRSPENPTPVVASSTKPLYQTIRPLHRVRKMRVRPTDF